MVRRVVMVTDSFEACHRWKACELDEVAFLQNAHRHKFLVKVEVAVEDGDRAVEFFMLKKDVKVVISKLPYLLSGEYSGKVFVFDASCEQMAEVIGRELASLSKDYNVVAVEVWEDGENGGRVEFVK